MASWIYTATAHEYILHRPMQCYCIKRHTLVFTKKIRPTLHYQRKVGRPNVYYGKRLLFFLSGCSFLSRSSCRLLSCRLLAFRYLQFRLKFRYLIIQLDKFFTLVLDGSQQRT